MEHVVPVTWKIRRHSKHWCYFNKLADGCQGAANAIVCHLKVGKVVFSKILKRDLCQKDLCHMVADIFRNLSVFYFNKRDDGLYFILINCAWQVKLVRKDFCQNWHSRSVFSSFLDSLAPIAVVFYVSSLRIFVLWCSWPWGCPLSQRQSIWWRGSVTFGFVFLFAFSLAFARRSSFVLVPSLRIARRFVLAFSLSLAFSFSFSSFLILSTVISFGGLSCILPIVGLVAILWLVWVVWPCTLSWVVPRSPRIQVGISIACLLRVSSCSGISGNCSSGVTGLLWCLDLVLVLECPRFSFLDLLLVRVRRLCVEIWISCFLCGDDVHGVENENQICVDCLFWKT